MKHLLLSAGFFLMLSACTNQSTGKVKIPQFNNVDGLRDGIAGAGYNVRKWWSDGQGWLCATDYLPFGSPGPTGMPNNAAFYLTSESEDFVRTMKFIVNLNNRAERQAANEAFKAAVNNFLKVLKLPPPPDFDKAVDDFKPVLSSSDQFTMEFKPIKNDRVDELQFVLTSK